MLGIEISCSVSMGCGYQRFHKAGGGPVSSAAELLSGTGFGELTDTAVSICESFTAPMTSCPELERRSVPSQHLRFRAIRRLANGVVRTKHGLKKLAENALDAATPDLVDVRCPCSEGNFRVYWRSTGGNEARKGMCQHLEFRPAGGGNWIYDPDYVGHRGHPVWWQTGVIVNAFL